MKKKVWIGMGDLVLCSFLMRLDNSRLRDKFLRTSKSTRAKTQLQAESNLSRETSKVTARVLIPIQIVTLRMKMAQQISTLARRRKRKKST